MREEWGDAEDEGDRKGSTTQQEKKKMSKKLKGKAHKNSMGARNDVPRWWKIKKVLNRDKLS